MLDNTTGTLTEPLTVSNATGSRFSSQISYSEPLSVTTAFVPAGTPLFIRNVIVTTVPLPAAVLVPLFQTTLNGTAAILPPGVNPSVMTVPFVTLISSSWFLS